MLRTTQERKRREMDYQHRLEEEVRRASAADQAKTHFASQHEPRHTHTHQHHHGYAGDHRAEPGGCDAGAVLPGEAQTAARYLLALVNDVLTLNRPKQEALGKTPIV